MLGDKIFQGDPNISENYGRGVQISWESLQVISNAVMFCMEVRAEVIMPIILCIIIF